MKKIFLIAIGLLLLGSSAFFIKAESANVPKFVSYQTVLTQNKPGVLYFYSRTCGHCVTMAPIINKLQKEYSNTYNFAKIDVDNPRNARICNQNNIWAVPAIYLYNPKKQTLGPIPPQYFTERLLREILTRYPNKIK
jgi:thiol-disulfide isomerase/thioredoxin